MKRLLLFAVIVTVVVLAPAAVLLSAGQGAWVKDARNPILLPGTAGSWDDRNVYSSDVIEASGQFRMWYTGAGYGNSQSSIGYATSGDGFVWTKDRNNPVLRPGNPAVWDGQGVSAPAVIYDTASGIWKMWYVGFSSLSGFKIGYATSPDGITWTKYAGNPVLGPSLDGGDDQNVVSPNVMYKDHIYRMWYAGRGNRNQIFYAASPDGIIWTKHPSNPVVRLGGDFEWDNGEIAAPSVLWTGVRYEMWYQGYSRSTQQRYIGHATSADAVHWNKDGLNPVVGLEPGSWDQFSVYYPSVSTVNGRNMMWYHGEPSFATAQKIGVVVWDKDAVATPLPTFLAAPTEDIEPTNTPTGGGPTPTPRPTPEQFGVKVNDGALYANQISVTLSITAPVTAPKMMVSNSNGFPGGQWTPYTAQLPWTLDPSIQNREPHIVFVRLGDPAGNIKAVVEDDIRLDFSIPSGQIVILSPAVAAANTTATLLLEAEDADSGVEWMLLSNDPNFAGAAWESYTASKAWTFDACGEVHGQYKDRAGNISPLYSAKVDGPKPPTLYLPIARRDK